MIHLINSGAATLDATGELKQDGQPVMKPFWDITEEEAKAALMQQIGILPVRAISVVVDFPPVS